MDQQIKDEQLKLLFAGLPSSLAATLMLLILTATLCHADVLVDPSRFLQVMANLLSNASKFS